MFKKINKKTVLTIILSSLILSIISFFLVNASASREVTLTTYYPAPYGNYNQLTVSDKFLPPNKTTAQRDAILNPSAGLLIYNTTTNEYNVYKTTPTPGWFQVGGGGWTLSADSTSLYPTGQDITPTSPKVGIGTASPRGNLDVKAGNSGFYLLDDLNHTYPRLYFGGTDQNVAVVLNRIIPGASFFIGEDGDAGNFFVRNSGALYLGSDWNPAIYASSGNGGNVGIGTTSPKRKLHIANLGPWTGGLLITNGNGTLETGDYATQIGTGFIQMRDGPWYQSVYLMTAWSNLYIGTDPTQGNIYLGLDTAGTHRGAVYYWSINQTSDIRLKKNISTINKALDKVLKMRGILFEWKNEKLEGKHYGVIAQEIEKVLPEVVSTDKSGKKYVAYTEIIPVLIEAVKEQQKQMAGQQKQIVELKDRQKTQQKQIAKLMAQNKLLEQRLKAVEKSIKVK